MSKFAAFIFILALRIFYQPSDSQKDFSPFTKPSQTPEIISQFIQPRQISDVSTFNYDAISPSKKDFENGAEGTNNFRNQKIEK